MFDTYSEKERLNILKKYQIIDTPSDSAFDKITKFATQLFNAPISLISLVDEDRVWFKSVEGLDLTEIPKEKGFCGSVILSDDIFEIQDISKQPTNSQNASICKELGLRFYASVPLKVEGKYNLGTLCILDKKPRVLTEKEKETLKSLAGLAIEQLEHHFLAKKAIQTQEHTLDMMEALYESSNYSKSFIGKDLRIIHTNQVTKDICKVIFGREPQKGDLLLDFILPIYQSEFKELYKKVLAGESIETEKIEGENWWKFRMMPVYDKSSTIIGIAHSLENITQQKNMTKKAKDLKNNLDILAQNFPDGSISLIDKNMKVLYTGGQGYKIYNIEPTRFFGKHVSEMLIPNLYRKLQEVIPQIWRGLTVSYEVDYKEQVFLTKVSPIKNKNEQIETFVLAVTDITNQKQKEIRIQKQNERLKEIAWQQSHEVRRPVATILGLINLIKMEESHEYVLSYLNYLQYEVKLLDEIIHKIVDATNEY
ncbi:PAS domain-containing protein [Bernardetia sp. ABR2-2B]|uniref:PAS domain-containing protein n=1 Tax=Bernardetia sp. ABR2-2B TaxID=3127472 RepID=UPI0030D14D2A